MHFSLDSTQIDGHKSADAIVRTLQCEDSEFSDQSIRYMSWDSTANRIAIIWDDQPDTVAIFALHSPSALHLKLSK